MCCLRASCSTFPATLRVEFLLPIFFVENEPYTGSRQEFIIIYSPHHFVLAIHTVQTIYDNLEVSATLYTKQAHPATAPNSRRPTLPRLYAPPRRSSRRHRPMQAGISLSFSTSFVHHLPLPPNPGIITSNAGRLPIHQAECPFAERFGSFATSPTNSPTLTSMSSLYKTLPGIATSAPCCIL